MRLFLWDGPRPHYEIDPQAPFLDLAEAMRQAAAKGARPASSEGAMPRAGWEISVDVIQAQTNSRAATVLIAADQELPETFHFRGDAQSRGLSVLLPDLFDEAGKLAVHARPAGGNEWVHVGELPRPVDQRTPQAGRERATEYPRRYHLSLDDRGILRVHLGELPYWLTEDLNDWKDKPGRVLRQDLELVEPPARETRDPFCGVH
jgi:hypothetical protein